MVFILLILIYILFQGGIRYNDALPIFYILPPLISINLYSDIFSKEFKNKFWGLLSSYQENKKSIFIYKHTFVCLVFLFTLLMGSILLLLFYEGSSNSLWEIYILSFFSSLMLGNLAAFISTWTCQYELGLTVGIIALLGIIKIPIPLWIIYCFYPTITIITLAFTYRNFIKKEGVLK